VGYGCVFNALFLLETVKIGSVNHIVLLNIKALDDHQPLMLDKLHAPLTRSSKSWSASPGPYSASHYKILKIASICVLQRNSEENISIKRGGE
jgi:hypothetical protein